MYGVDDMSAGPTVYVYLPDCYLGFYRVGWVAIVIHCRNPINKTGADLDVNNLTNSTHFVILYENALIHQ